MHSYVWNNCQSRRQINDAYDYRLIKDKDAYNVYILKLRVCRWRDTIHTASQDESFCIK